MFTGVNKGLRFVGEPTDVAAFLEEQGDAATAFLSDKEEFGQCCIFRGPEPGQDLTARDVHGYAPEKTWAVTMERAERYRHMAAVLAENPDLGSRSTDLVNAAEIVVEIGEIVMERKSVVVAVLTSPANVAGTTKTLPALAIPP